MPSLPIRFSVAILATALAGCSADVAGKEDMLTAAGFAFKPADTPERIASMKALPPHRFVHQMHNGQLVWLYADPSICVCVYAGDQAAYAKYQQEAFQKHIADEQQSAAMMNEDAAMQANMNFGMWGGGPWGPYGY